MVGGTDKEKTIAQESTHSSAWSSREKKNSFSRQPLSQGHKGLGEILHWVMNFRNPAAKTALRKFPRKSKWTQEQAQTRNARTAADAITPKHMPGLLPPGSPANSTTTPWICTQSTPDPAVPGTGSTAGLGSDQGTPSRTNLILGGFPSDLQQAPLPTVPAQVSLTAD